MENIVSMDKTGYFDTLPYEIDIPSPKADSPGSTGILLSTLWSQSGVISIGSNTSIKCNEYTPIDPTTSTHSVTGCTNTAAAQILYYLIEKKGLKLSLTLQSSDAYTSKKGSITINVKADGSTPGTISFATVNSRLGSYQLNSAMHAATLMYACGVVQEAAYSSDGTSTGWDTDLFYRAGLKSANKFYLGTTPNASSYWGTNDASGNFTISSAGYEVIIENLQAGRPVGVSYPGHALVIDGYDSSKDLFHINFGWGKSSSSTRWYSRSEMREQGYHEFVYDLMVDRVETLTVTDSRVYGTGTMVRAMEQARSITGSNTVTFSSAVSGKSVQLTEYMRIKDSTTIRNFNMSVTVTNARNFSWGTAFYAEADSFAKFENFGGALIVNTAMDNNVAVYCHAQSRLSFSANNTLIYGGNYAYGAASVLSTLRTARDNGTTPSSSVTSAAQYSFYGSDNNDSITLSGRSLVVGKVYLRGGSDVLSVTDRSRLYGDISGDGSKTITVDSSSSITGLLSSTSALGFVLNSAADSHALFTVEKNVSSVYSYATVSVDITDAEVGTYTLFAAASGASNVSQLNNITLTVTGSGEADYTLRGSGTSTSTYANVIYESQKLKLQVKVAPSSLMPKVVSVYASATAPTNKNVTVYASFDSNTKIKQYSLNGSTWNTYGSGVTLSSNGTVYFRGRDGGSRISDVVSYTVSNIDKTAPVKPTAKASTTAPTNKSVTVTATYSSDSATKQYSLNNSTWLAYTTGVSMTDNGKVYFRGIDAAGNVSAVTTYNVSNIDKVAPVKPTAKASTTAVTNRKVTVTAAYSSDTAKKQYSLDNKSWQAYTTGVVMKFNGTVYFRGIDAAGNVSPVVSYKVANIKRGPLDFVGDIGFTDFQDTFSVALSYPGWYTIGGDDFGVLNGSVSILQGKNTVASGTIKKGVLTFNNGKNLLLDSANKYTIVVKNSDKGKSASDYEFSLTAKGLFKNANQKKDDNWKTAPKLSDAPLQGEWVGYGDKIDYRKLAVDKKGGFYSFKLSGVVNNVKLTVYADNGGKLKQVKTVTAKAKSTASTGDLCLKGGTYYLAVEAPGAAKAQNSSYTVNMASKGTFNHRGNETCGTATWRNATPANIGDGLLTTAAGGDKIDYFDISKIAAKLKTLDVGQGKLKVSFYDKNNKAVKVAQVKMANNSIKKNVSALTLVAGDKVTGITLGALVDIKYLKIEAATNKVNTYKLSLLA